MFEKFATGYEYVHASTGVAQSRVSDKVDLRTCKMTKRKARNKTTPPTYSMGQTMRISKKKMLFVKGFEKNWTLEVFRNSKLLRRSPFPVYEMEECEAHVSTGGAHSYQYHEEDRVTNE